MLNDRELKPEEPLLVDDCHWYSIVPASPEGSAVLVNEEGIVPAQMVCVAVMVPPEVGLLQP